MKNLIIALLILLPFASGFSQGLTYDVRGSYAHPIKVEALQEAKTMSDVSPGYPASWITEYISVEITATTNGQTEKAVGANDTFTAEQRNIIRKSGTGTDVVFDVFYRAKNSVTGKMEKSTLKHSVTVMPEREAQYPGGSKQLDRFIKANAIDKIPEAKTKEFSGTDVTFTVNENGKIAGAKITRESGEHEIDELLLEAIRKMPAWKPAQDANGANVKQKFVVSLGNPGC